MTRRQFKHIHWLAAFLATSFASLAPVKAEELNVSSSASAAQTSLAPLRADDIAQALPPPRDDSDVLPVDLTPVRLPERGSAFTTLDTFKASALYNLPARMFFAGVVENSLRDETNVFQTENHNKNDMIYRVFPNVTVGYALTPKTRVAANYFFFRDQYTVHNQLNRNIHSVGGRIDHDIPINNKTTLTLGFFARELLFNFNGPNTPLNDLIPSMILTHRVGASSLVYASLLGQIRFQDVLGRFQEGDQFYSFGGLWRKRGWLFLTDCTLDSNFGNSRLRGGHNNQVVVLTMEASHRLHRNIPVSAFIRAEPIFNIGANSSPGFAGFNFRIFGGLRGELSKPAIFPVKVNRG